MTTEMIQPEHGSPWRGWRTWLLAFFVVLLGVVIYRPSFDADFQALDDPQYTFDNAYILIPTVDKLKGFFSEVWIPSTVAGYYQPLTMASLMLDRVIEGSLRGGYSPDLDPFIYHLTNTIIHGLNAGLLFLLITFFTRNRGIGLFCGLLFAFHPINVEATAWVCQRKALLSTFFALGMILSYGRYAKSRESGWYGLVILTYGLSMLAKPTGMLLPFVLVLADIWPLKRFSRKSILEKLPLFVLAVVGGYIAYVSQRDSAGMSATAMDQSMVRSLLILCFNVAFYPAKVLVPVGLCPQYPMPSLDTITITSLPFFFGVMGTLAITGVVLLAYVRRWRAVWVCIVAFMLLLGPALSPRRFMGAIAADRFCYQSMIPLFFLLAAGLVWLLAKKRRETLNRFGGPVGLSILGVLVLGTFAWLTHVQQRVWHNSETYFSRVCELYPDDPFGYYGLGQTCLLRHDRLIRLPAFDEREAEALLDSAMVFFHKTIEIEPTYSVAYYQIGQIMVLRGNLEEAREMISKGYSLPNADSHGEFYLAWVNGLLGNYEEAIPLYYSFLRRNPGNRESRRNLGNALLRAGRAAEALPQFEELYRLDPNDVDGIQNWGIALMTDGQLKTAISVLKGAVSRRVKREHVLQGVQKAQEQSKLASARYTLGAAYAMAGHIDSCLKHLIGALDIQPELLYMVKDHPAFEDFRKTRAWQYLNNRFGSRAYQAMQAQPKG